MPIVAHDFELHKLLNGGRREPLRVGRLDRELGRKIGAHTEDVMLTQATAQKQRYKHEEILVNQYGLIGLALEHAHVFEDKARHLLFLLEDRDLYGGFFKVVVKANKAGDELLMQSFHKVEAKRFRSKMKRGRRIRPQRERGDDY